MRILRRILVTLVVTLTLAFIAIYRIAPVALSFYESRKALPITRVIPIDLGDNSISQAPGTRLSYLGYDFDVPWTDLDESQTELFPKNKPDKSRARLHLRSGLQIVLFTTSSSHTFYDQFTTEIKMSPEAFAAVFGARATNSDYEFMKRVFEFSPDKIPHWTTTSAIQSQTEVLLLAKSIVPVSSAETGVFNLHNASLKGFQQGDPQNPRTSKNGLLLSLYSDNAGVEILIVEKDYTTAGGVTQPEINRIVQSLHQTGTKVASASV
jgi:hypothetical protein